MAKTVTRNLPFWAVVAVISLVLSGIFGYVVFQYGWSKLPHFLGFSVTLFAALFFFSS